MRCLSVVVFAAVVVAAGAAAGCQKSGKPSWAQDAAAGGAAGSAAATATPTPVTPEAVLAKLEGFRDAACACMAPDCVKDVELEMRDWLLKEGPAMQSLQSTAAQNEAANKASSAMAACVDRILHPR
ncbi:MAG: hypothetical protein JNK64_11910 [Myxococcales bacterium]|nr:hypothetical protein [Myxococcales bacterium]